jgi:HNH endonuclease
MAPRIRSLKPEHRQHRKVGRLTHLEYRLWVGMLCEADDAGRLVCDAEQLRVLIFGFRPEVTAEEIDDGADVLAKIGLLKLYRVGGVRYAAFPSWTDHQRIDHPSKSKLPPPPSTKTAIPQSVRREVARRTGGVPGQTVEVACAHCNERKGTITWQRTNGWVHFGDLEMDHVIPESQGGTTTAENLVLSCRHCNRSRSKTPREDSRGLANPRVGSEGIGGDRKGKDRKGGDRSSRKGGDASPLDPPLVANAFQTSSTPNNDNQPPGRRPAPGEFADLVARLRRAHPDLPESDIQSRAVREFNASLR